MDFLNTTLTPRGRREELIGDGQAFVAWLVDAGLLDASIASKLRHRFGASALDGVAAKARKVREWSRDWILRWRDAPDSSYEPEINHLNNLLKQANTCFKVVITKGHLQMARHCRMDSADELIALVAEQIALLITSERPSLVKCCAGLECTLWFLDRTKAHRRLFCSADVCGNRAKVAAFRKRREAII